MAIERRSGDAAACTLELWPDLEPDHGATVAGPVGGRQAQAGRRRRGGGYLNERTAPEVRRLWPLAQRSQDSRMLELEEIGLSSMWMGVAEFLGFDRFMGLWRQLSSDSRALTDDNQILIMLRDFHWYERMQRDLFIRRMAACGYRAADIHLQLRTQFGDRTTSRAMVEAVASKKWAESRMVARYVHGLSPYMQDRIRTAADHAHSQDLFPAELERSIVAEACRDLRPKGPSREAALMAELIDIGLSGACLTMAREIGYADFVTLWRAWSADRSLRKKTGLIELRLRGVRAFDRYQRNRYIETLVAGGMKPRQICSAIRDQIGEALSERQLQRLVRSARASAGNGASRADVLSVAR